MKKIFYSSLFILFLTSLAIAQEEKPKGPERWEETIQKFEASDKENPKPEGANLFVGSSSFAIWKDIQDYFPDYQIINRGFGGSNYEDLLYYVDRVVIPYKPAKVFIYEGDNDVARGDEVKDILKRVKKVRKIIKKKLPETEVAILAAKPSIRRWELADEYIKLNQELDLFACKTDKTEFVDVWNPVIGEDGKVFDHIFLEDNLHMNAEGYKIWQKIIEPYLVK